mgnify:CR=1 FL=1
MCKCDECMFGNQKEVDCNGFSCGEFYELQQIHDKLIRVEAYDNCIKFIRNSIPDNDAFTRGLLIKGLKLLKEQNINGEEIL